MAPISRCFAVILVPTNNLRPAAGLGNVGNVHATLQQLTQQGGALQQQIGALQQQICSSEFQNVQQEFQNVQQQLNGLQHEQQRMQARIANITIRRENEARARHRLLPPVRLQVSCIHL